MCRDIVVAPCTSLIDLPALPDEIIISDIAPSADYGMVVVDSADKSKIVLIGLIVLGGMMDDDAFHLFRFLYRPYERMSVLIIYTFDCPILFGEVGCEMARYGLDFRFICESGIGFRFISIRFEFLEYRLPYRTVFIAERFIRSPVRPFDDAGAIGPDGRLCGDGTENDMRVVRIGIEAYDGDSRYPNIRSGLDGIEYMFGFIEKQRFRIVESFYPSVSVLVYGEREYFSIRHEIRTDRGISRLYGESFRDFHNEHILSCGKTDSAGRLFPVRHSFHLADACCRLLYFLEVKILDFFLRRVGIFFYDMEILADR